MTHIRAVCFDGFGSLVDIATDGLRSGNLSCNRLHYTGRGAIRKVRNSPSIVDKGLEAQCAAAYMRAGVDMLWATLRRIDVKIIVRLNRTAGLEQALLSLIPGIPDLYFSNTASNFPDIISKRFHLSIEQILFITSGHAIALPDSISPSITIENFEDALYYPGSQTMAQRIPRVIADFVELLWDASEGGFRDTPALHSQLKPHGSPSPREVPYPSLRMRENASFYFPPQSRRNLRKWRRKHARRRSIALRVIGRTIGRQYL